MFYFILVFVIISFFLLLKERKNHAIRYSIFTMACYTCALIAFILYISKDSYYYNMIDYLFSIPLPIWNEMMFIDIPMELLIRVFNFFILGTIFFSFQFVFSYMHYKNSRKYSIAIVVFLLFEFIIYDPAVYRFLYLNVWPDFMTYETFISLWDILHIITVSLNCIIVCGEIIFMWLNYRKISPIKAIRHSTRWIYICHTLIMISFVLLFGYYPMTLIKVSKIADLTTYVTAPISNNKIFTTLFPYYLLISFLLICIAIYRSSRIEAQLKDESYTISKQISAADVTSKAFSHFIKNEVLAIQSEVEMIDPSTDEQKEALNDIDNRCKYLYERLDILYNNSKSSYLTLKKRDVDEIIEQLLCNLSYELQNCTVSYDPPAEKLYAMIDETYFYQALHNIVSNALDAMNDLPANSKNLDISVASISNWICIAITDTGKGMNSGELSQIFTPFYTSYPIRTHWGIGLSLTYKIIEAHEGKIDVKSSPGKGTTVNILLPQISKNIGEASYE